MTLSAILTALCNDAGVDTTAADSTPHPHYLLALVDVIRPHTFGQAKRTQQATENLLKLISLLETTPEYRTALHDYIGALLENSHHFALYTESGIQSERGFFSEAWIKITQFILPPVHDAHSLRGLVNIFFHSNDDYLWFCNIPDNVLGQLITTLDFATPTTTIDVHVGSYNKLLDAMLVLSHKIVAMAMEPDVLNRLPMLSSAYRESAAMKGLAFLEQHREITRYIEEIRTSGQQPLDSTNADNHAIVMLSQCEDAIDYIRRRRDRFGTSLHLTYQMQRIRQHIHRLLILIDLTRKPLPSSPNTLAKKMVSLWKEVVTAENTQHRLSKHFNDNTELLALQMSENAAKTGEHYITTTAPEFRAFLFSSLGGGFIVAFIACLKLFVSYRHFPPLIEAFGYSLNYALGFIIIHVCGFKLATKQPAMTASTIAESLNTRQTGHQTSATGENTLQELVRTIARTSRSQLISFVGNLGLAMPTGLVLAVIYQWISGTPMADPVKAQKMLLELHPFLSLSLLYGGIAGVFLFTAGLISGYYDNQVVFHNIPERPRRPPVLRRLVSAPHREQFAKYIEHNLGALAGNFFLGFMLGMAGLLGFLTGLPIDIRHITFAGANACIALVSLNFEVHWTSVVITLVGILGIGVVNFMVSFGLALFVAMRSRKVDFRQSAKLLALLGTYLRTNTREFFLPPRTTSSSLPQ